MGGWVGGWMSGWMDEGVIVECVGSGAVIGLCSDHSDGRRQCHGAG